ncbi:unnamed protein product [Discosporangium mesarthrocarpum]
MKMLREESLGDPESRGAILFRRRFRVPYPFFVPLVREVRQQSWLGSSGADAAGRQASPWGRRCYRSFTSSEEKLLDDMFFMARMSEGTA